MKEPPTEAAEVAQPKERARVLFQR